MTGEPWNHTDWHAGEPNDSPHDSNALELAVIWGGQWDGRLAAEALLPGSVVEFEPPASEGATSAGLVLDDLAVTPAASANSPAAGAG